jgi:alpha-L-arabinofuranosidase
VRAAVEALERRALLSVGPIPTVPTPAAHWTFDDGGGTTAADSSGNGHTATLGTGAGWAAGNVGTNAMTLNGTSTAVATATGPVVNTAGSFTASAWVKLNSLSGYQTFVSIAGTTVAGFFLQLRGDTGTFGFARLSSDANGGATLVSAPSAPVTGTWYHLVGVDDATAGTLTLYIDGQSIGTVPFTSGWTAGGDTLIGHGFYNGGQVDFVNGSIDDVELFSSALSAAQVVALDQPAAYSFDDGTGTTAADVSGHGNTLNLGTGASWAGGRIGSNSLAVNGSITGNATFASPVLNTAQPFSVSAWVNLNSTSGYQTFASIDGTNVSGFYLQLRGDNGKFSFARLGSDSTSASVAHADATSAPTIGTWYNLIGVDNVATGQLQLYVNGVLQSTVAYSGNWQASGATVVGGGKYSGSRVDFVNGEIDDVRFYDSPLSANAAAYIGTAGGSILNINTAATGATLPSTFFGAFMEDINFGGEGGIYNDEIRNSGFNDSSNALNAWSAVAGSGVSDSLAPDTTTGPNSALTQSGKLTITSGVSASARAGIANSGYFGVAVAPSTSYTVQFYATASAGFTGPLSVDLESNSGTIYASATIPSITTSWQQYTATLTTGAGAPTSSTNRFVISTNSTSANGKTIWFGAAYLFPPAYNGASNHLRTDLMQKLVAMQPAVFRVPGGNYLEGNDYSTRFQWSNTIGPVQDRPGHFNSAWGYWSTDGMGLDEYLQMAEESGASPVLAVYAGYTLNGSSDAGATLTADVTDAVNELHYALDPVNTVWGLMRANNGHPAAYNVSYVEIGNEDFFSSTYSTRYPLFYNAIHAAFPSLKIIATSTSTGGSPFDVLDDHYYHTPAWFEANSNHYDSVARGSYKIFVGEWASNEGSPTNDMNSALGDASWLLGLERNSDLVTMESYAPLWVNVNGHQWTPDLIGFNNTSSYGSPSYWAQVMLAQNHGSTVVSNAVTGATGLETLVTRNGSNYYLTVVNTTGADNNSTVNVNGVGSVAPNGTAVTLSALSANATNSITSPTNIVPVSGPVSGLDTTFSYDFPAYSVTVLQFTTSSVPSVYTGTSGADNYYVRLAADGTTEQIWVGSTTGTGNPTYSIAKSQLGSLTFNGMGGADSLTVDFLNGNPVPVNGIDFDGGAGSTGNLLVVDGSGNPDTAVLNASTVVFNSAAAITYANTQSLTLNTAGGNDVVTQAAQPGAPTVSLNVGGGSNVLNVNGGTFTFTSDAGAGSSTSLSINVANAGSSVTFTGTQHLAALSITASGTAKVTAAASDLSPALVNITSLTFDTNSASKLDLANNELLTGTSLTSVRSQIANSHIWTSTSGRFIGSLDLGGGQAEARATLLGDSNLDGNVNVADLANLAGNYGKTSGGVWVGGDFDYNNTVNVADLADLAGNFGANLGFSASAASTAAAPALVGAKSSSPAAVAPGTPPANSPTPFSQQFVQNPDVDELLDSAAAQRDDLK